MLTEGTLVAGRYLVTARFGQGGMGAVYLVRDERLGRRAALKVFAARPEETSLARFRREARIMARLRHPHLAAVYETTEVDGLPALVQEYVEGRDLQDVLGAGACLDEASSRRLAEQIASALALLHASGVVHRDVKPGNVMMEPSGRFGGGRASPGLAPDLARVVNACCRLDPELRPADGGALLALMRSPVGRSGRGADDSTREETVTAPAEREGSAPGLRGVVRLIPLLRPCRSRGRRRPAWDSPRWTFAGAPRAATGAWT